MGLGLQYLCVGVTLASGCTSKTSRNLGVNDRAALLPRHHQHDDPSSRILSTSPPPTSSPRRALNFVARQTRSRPSPPISSRNTARKQRAGPYICSVQDRAREAFGSVDMYIFTGRVYEHGRAR